MGLEPQYSWHQANQPTNRCQYVVAVDNGRRECGRLTHNRWFCKEHHKKLTDQAGEEWTNYGIANS